MNIYPAKILKQNFNEAISINEKKKPKKTQNKTISLIIPNREWWHYISVKKYQQY